MSHDQFEQLRSSMFFSGNCMSEEQLSARLDFVTDFVKAINDHFRSFITPLDQLFVDEGVLR